MIQQPIDHMRGFMGCSRNDFGVIGVKLIRDMRIEDDPRFGTILGIDLGGGAFGSARREALSI